MEQSRFKERRMFPRTKVIFPAQIRNMGLTISSTDIEVRDLSCNGVLLRTNRYIEPFTRTEIKMFLPTQDHGKKREREVSAEGVIVRTDPESTTRTNPEYDVAIFFPSLSTSDREAINSFLDDGRDG